MMDVSTDIINENINTLFPQIHTEDRKEFFRVNDLALQTRSTFSHEMRMLTRGRIRWFWFQSVPHLATDGKWYWHGTVIDITQRKEAEYQQAELLNRYQTFMQISSTGAWEYDVNNDRLWFSDEYLNMIGLDAKQYRKRYGEKVHNWIELMHPEDRDPCGKKFRDYFEDENDTGIYENHFRMKHKNGGWVWIWSRGQKLFDLHGNYQWKVVGTHIDITEARNKEQSLINSELNYRIAAEYSPDWEYWVRPDRTFEYISPHCFKICGYTADEFKADTNLFDSIIHPEDELIWKRHVVVKQGDPSQDDYHNIKFRLIHKDGSEKWIEHVCKSVYDATGRYLGQRGTNRDISLQVHALNELQKLHKAVEHSPATIIITDIDGNIEYVNPKFSEVSGYTLEEVLGKPPAILSRVDASSDEYAHFKNTLRSGQVWSGEFQNQRKNGEQYWEHALVAPVFNEKGLIANYIGVMEDITDLKIREKELNEVVKIASHQNKQLQEFNYILSHNIRSHAANIAAIVYEMRDSSDPAVISELVRLLDNVSQGLLNTLSNLNENITIQREVNLNKEKLCLKDYIDETLKINRALIDEFGVKVHVSVSDDISIQFNRAYLQSIVQNLISNAIRYRSITRPPEIHIAAMREQSHVQLSIKDNGLGIDLSRHGNRIFNLGQIFHNHPDSRGLGLYIVRNQVNALGGGIRVESSPGNGSTFIVKFPSGHDE